MTAKDLCLATVFTLQCDRHHCKKLVKELENNFTKDHNENSLDMVKAHQLLNECKRWRSVSSAPQSEGVAFAHKGKQEGNPNKGTSSPTVFSSRKSRETRTMTKTNKPIKKASRQQQTKQGKDKDKKMDAKDCRRE
jgi:hypothetical protein